MKEYDGKVRVVFKNMVVHPQQVTNAHLAGCAAAKQGKFIAYKDAPMSNSFPGMDPYLRSGRCQEYSAACPKLSTG